MDARNLFDQILNSGKTLLQQGQDFAEDKLGVPGSGEGRSQAVAGLGKGALAGGLLALLVGTKTGRKTGGKLLKYGSIAAVAAVAYKTYQSWQESEDSSSEIIASGEPIATLDDRQASERALLLIRSMIAAANADGVIDAAEHQAIQGQVAQLGLEEQYEQILTSELASPQTAPQIAQQVDSPASASEVFLLSSLICDETNPAEARYLETLAKALRLPPQLAAKLAAEATA